MGGRPAEPRSRSFFIATTPRSGSWLLAEGLRAFGIAGNPEEYFNVALEPLYRAKYELASSAPYGDLIRHILLDGRTENGVFAAKLHWFQLEHLTRRLRELDGVWTGGDGRLLRAYFGEFRVVYLERRNTLRQAISWHRAICTDDWWQLAGTVPAQQRVDYNFESTKHLYYLLREYKSFWRSWLRENAPDAMTLFYEDLAHDYADGLRRVLRYVDLPEPDDIPSPVLERQDNGVSADWAGYYHESWLEVFGGG